MRKIVKGFLIVGLAFVISGYGRIEDSTESTASSGGVKSQGVVHNIASDRTVERVGGIYQPEALDKYLKRKFDAVEKDLDAINSKLDKIELLLQQGG